MFECRFEHCYSASFKLKLAFTAPSGITAVLGHSGAGKTSLLRLIAGLERATTGFCRVESEYWQQDAYFAPAHARSVGYMFQEARLFPHLTVAQNIAYVTKRAKAHTFKYSTDDAIDLLGIAPLLQRAPQYLSGGEKQRVALVRALASQPKMLLMDEPLSSLDEALKQEIRPYIASISQMAQVPILYVTHDRQEAKELAQSYITLTNGRVTAQAEISDLVVNEKEGSQPNQALTQNDDAVFLSAFSQLSADRKVELLAKLKNGL